MQVHAMGMGNFIGVADDATALYWNPAGTATIDYTYATLEDGQGMQVLASGRSRSLQLKSETTPATYSANVTPSFLGILVPYKRSVLNGKPVSLGRFDPSIVFSAAYQSMTDANLFTIQQSNPSISETLKSGLNLSNASVSGAYQLSPYMSVGVTANYWFGLGNQFDYTATERTNNIVRNEVGKYKISGLNFVAGMMFDFYEDNLPLRIGIRATTPFSLRNQFSSEGNVQANTLETRVRRFYDQKYKMPITAGVGVSYRLIPSLLIALDAEFLPYQGQTIQQTFFDYNQFNSLYPNRGVPLLTDLPQRPTIANSNHYQLRSGGEFLLLDTGTFEMRVMGGYRLQTYINPDATSSRATSFSLGATVFFDRFKIHAAYEQMKYPQTTTTTVSQFTRNYISFDLVVLLRN
ncbi:MAG: hypothetical protein R2822_27255 [Spirosomataceae bacterium]